MGKFDLATFGALTGQGRGTIASVGSAFGMPSCMLNLTHDVLSLLPSPVLNSMRGSADAGRQRADELTKDAFKALMLNTGIIEFDTEEGVFKFISDSSKGGLDSDEGGLLSQLGGFLAAVDSAVGFGTQLYKNYQTTTAQIDGIKNCIESYERILAFQGGSAVDKRQELAALDPVRQQEIFNARFEVHKRGLDQAKEFTLAADELVQNIDDIVLSREQNPDLEPAFNLEFSSEISGTGFKLAEDPETEEDDEKILRLIFGPPQSSKGHFLLSVDGLYYDSQTDEGLTPVLTTIESKEAELKQADRWTFEYDPNIGGKGTEISLKDLNVYVNTIFDPTIVDDSDSLQTHYKADHFLQVLEGEKNKRTFDLSAQVQELIDAGSAEALIVNARQALISEIGISNGKVIRRKKQIEVAVKAPAIYGTGGGIFAPGEVPINDFSYLKGFNLSTKLENQKALVLDQAEVSSVVLPLKPTFVVSKGGENSDSVDHLIVPPVGEGGIIHTGGVFEVSAPKLSITNNISTDGLFAIYNYLQTNIESSDSNNFTVLNCATSNNYNNAQLVTDSAAKVFGLGLGIPKLNGITEQNGSTPTIPSGVGSYIRLPETKEFMDLMYQPQGFTFESWLEVPGINDFDEWHNFGASSLYRLILANENVGSKDNTIVQTNSERLIKEVGDNVVRGFVMGFTRDERLTKVTDGNNLDSLDHNSPVSSLSFFMAPTQSRDSSAAGFINNTQGDFCASAPGWYGLFIEASAANSDGIKFIDCCGEFCLLTVSVKPEKDEVKVYLDSSLMATKSIVSVFGTGIGQAPQIPTSFKSNSFRYNDPALSASMPLELSGGPKLDTVFTPWILGGGYTDGLYTQGNFMGGTFGGVTSGFKGHLGSTKFYSRAISPGEVSQNYIAQKDFFKNIKAPNTCWDTILIT